jgi:hypothetical protein
MRIDSMTSAATPDLKPSPKPLGLLGRDEMNLAEFPITLLTDRVPKDQKEAVYQDEIFDERTGLTLTRKLTISAGNHGLTTAADDEVILSLIQLTKQKNNFTDRKLTFSRHELVQTLGWSVGGASYERILLSLKRWTSVFLQYQNAWRDNRTKTWTTAGFHIIDKYEITDTRLPSEQLDLLPSYIIWGEDIFESFQAGYLKPLDYDLCMGLSNSTAKRMYRFLDKRFHHKPDWTFDIKEFAHEHIGLGRHYEGPAHLKRNLQPAISELESVGILEPLHVSERFIKDGKDWKIRLLQKAGANSPAPSLPLSIELETPPLVLELTKRGVTLKSAADLVQKHAADSIHAKIEVFDWLVAKQDKRVAKSPEGYLVKSICDDYKQPKGFVTSAEQQRQNDAKTAKARKEAEALRQRRQEEARELAERKAIADFWESRTPEQQEEVDAAWKAQCDPAKLAQERGPFKKMGEQLRREEYIRQLLATQAASTPVE